MLHSRSRFLNLMDAIMEGPLHGGMCDDDFYTDSMGQMVYRHYPDVEVDFRLTNRHAAHAPLAHELDVDELGTALDGLSVQRMSPAEAHYLNGTYEYGDRMFSAAYIGHLRSMTRGSYSLEVTDSGHLDLRFVGPWTHKMRWEVPALAAINGLRTRQRLKSMTRFQRDAALAQAIARLHAKIARLRDNPHVTFCDFGTRRRAHYAWQLYIDEVLQEEVPKQFVGTSNVESAMRTGLMPMGTNAHQLQMVIAALTAGASDPDAALRSSVQQMLTQWWEMYGEGLSIFLPDTFGSDSFYNQITSDQLLAWKGSRHDSGPPVAFGDMLIHRYEQAGIDPRDKLLIFSDGLDVPKMIQLSDHFGDRIKVTHGIGTNLTNDWGDLFPTRSVVVKPWFARRTGDLTWHPCVKLSDNIAKAIGPPEEIERYKRVFGYSNTYSHLQLV